MEEIITKGHFNSEGNLTVYGRDHFMEASGVRFKKKNVEVVIRERFNEFDDGYRRYYFKFVVRQLQKAYRSLGVIKTIHDVDYEMRERYLFYEVYNPELDIHEKFVHTLRSGETKVSGEMMREYLLLCVWFSITYLDWAIPLIGEDFTKEDQTDRQRELNYKNG